MLPSPFSSDYKFTGQTILEPLQHIPLTTSLILLKWGITLNFSPSKRFMSSNLTTSNFKREWFKVTVFPYSL